MHTLEFVLKWKVHFYTYFTFLVPVVTIVSNPAGTPVSGSTNTFDYPILSSVTLTCMVTSSDGSTFTVTNYQWDTTGCYTNNRINTPICFPHDQTTQSITGINLLAKDAGTITCAVTISGVDYTSDPLTLRISGISLCTWVCMYFLTYRLAVVTDLRAGWIFSNEYFMPIIVIHTCDTWIM